MKKPIVLILLILVMTGVFVLDIGQYLNLAFFKSQQQALESVIYAEPLLSGLSFFAVYIAVTALSLPGALLLTLIAGALFGFYWGLLIVSFASTIGATLAFLVSRLLLRDWVALKFAKQLKAVNQGVDKEGAFYLFSLRLIPLFPFFVINLLMGLTSIKTWTFFWVSQLGMLAGTMVYVNAGTQIASLESLSGIVSFPVLSAFMLLGLFPLMAKRVLALVAAKKIYRAWPKPKTFDNDVIVIGAGAGGLVSAYISAAVNAKVTLIEKSAMGGDCLNTGCVPSKAVIRSAKLRHQIATSDQWAVTANAEPCDMQAVMARVKKVIERIEPHDSVERYQNLGVNVIEGEAAITSPYTVTVDNQELTTRNIIVATGAGPYVPPIPGLSQINYLTSDNVWDLEYLPKRLIILGGGPIGCELTQAFSRLGSDVTQVEMLPRLMLREDKDISRFVEAQFKAEAINVMTDTKAVEVIIEQGEKLLVCEKEGQILRLPFDELLIAVGRKPHTQGFGLELLNIPLSANGTIEVNEYQQTVYPNIYAVGDVAGPYQFTHTAAHQAWYAAVNALFGVFKRFKTDYSVIPWATFIDPEVARVGLNEQEAQEQNVAYETTRYDIDDLDRAIADGSDKGFIKVLTMPGSDKILGVTIVGTSAGELIAEYVLAMKHGLGLNKILGTIHIYPTMMEANKYVAGMWKQQHKPERILKWLERWHNWRRG